MQHHTIPKNIHNLYYAGIGSRETPPHILSEMESIASELGQVEFILRSGGAVGADSAFAAGAYKSGSPAEIWVPWDGFNSIIRGILPKDKHQQLASRMHPVWSKLSSGAKKLHTRNVGQVLGMNFDLSAIVDYLDQEPNAQEGIYSTHHSEFVLCWTPDGAEHHTAVTSKTGGTGTAIKLASLLGIPVVNMHRSDWKISLEKLLTSIFSSIFS